MSADQGDSLATRQSLLSRLKNWGDEDSWRTFFNTYWKLIYGVALRSGLSEAESQDVVQETVIAVARKIPEFSYDPEIGSFKGWLLTQTRWKIIAQFRKRKGLVQASALNPDGTGGTDFMERIPDSSQEDLDRLWNEEWEKNLLEVAQVRVKRQANPKDYQIFDLHVQQQRPVREVMETIGVSRTHVYVAKHRVTSLLKKEIRRLEKHMAPNGG